MNETFRALVAEEVDGKSRSSFKELSAAELTEGEVTIAVQYSTVNYKDGLAVTGKGKIARRFPMICGIDLAGTVEQSDSPDFKPGDEVLCVGCGLSETIWGGYAEKARLPASCVVPLPAKMSLRQAMAIGTAGFTSMLAVMALEHMNITPGENEVLVTGAGGGVGSIAVALLAANGYKVAASTGRAEIHDYLRSLGAATIIARDELATPSGRPLDSERWAGAIDSVGGETLASLLRGTATNGAVAACGLAGGVDIPTTVMPFILRGVSLIGVNSLTMSLKARATAWRRLDAELAKDTLESITSEASLDDVPRLAEEILKGQIRGRVVINVNG